MKFRTLILLIFLGAGMTGLYGEETEATDTLAIVTPANVRQHPAPSIPGFGCNLRRFPLHLNVKSNLLYDVALLPNIGIEWYVGKNWSLTADWMYGWWDRDRSHFYWRAYGGTLGFRKWIGKKAAEKPLAGHHIGIFAGVVTYDFEFGHEGIMGGLPRRTLWDRCNFISGVEYGYSMPIARRLNLDFTIGVGYLGGKYIKYQPHAGGYEWKSGHQLTWIGPTKAEISLVWLIGNQNTNER